MTPPPWLHQTFVASVLLILGLVSLAMWRELRRPVVFEQRLVPALGLVDRCEGCHDAALHPGELTLSHPPERMGCTPCHGGLGLATTAEGAHQASQSWEHPLFTPLEQQAACGTCHRGDVEGAPLLVRGRRALDTLGCAGCHEIPGYAYPSAAPALAGLSDKVSPGWVRTWLREPAALNADHRMPAFDLGEAEREALLAFLMSLPGPDLVSIPAQLVGDPEAGRRAVATRRCATCHRIEDRGGGHAPDLALAGVKIAPDWFFSLLTDTHRLRPDSRMPGFRLPEQEAADIVAYAREQWVPDTEKPVWTADEGPVDPSLAAAGRQLFTERGCAGCHAVEGVARSRVGVAMGSLGSRHLIDLPAGPEGPAPDMPTWIATKVLDPHAFDSPDGVPAVMPAWPDLDPEEARALGVALTALRKDSPPAAYLVGRPEGGDRAAPAGETGQLVARYRCLVCHRIGDEGGEISRVPLDGVGARLQQQWLEAFLVQPVTVRMNQGERMPVLGITPPEAARLADWMETSLGDPRVAAFETASPSGDVAAGRRSYQASGCPACHIAEGQGTMDGPVLDGARDRLTRAYVLALLERGPGLVPGARHPEILLPADQATDITAYVLSLPAPAQQ